MRGYVSRSTVRLMRSQPVPGAYVSRGHSRSAPSRNEITVWYASAAPASSKPAERSASSELLRRAADLLLRAAVDEREGSRMAFLHGRPARDRGAHALLPGASAGEVEVEHVEDAVADRVQELVLVLDVRVEGRSLDAELARRDGACRARPRLPRRRARAPCRRRARGRGAAVALFVVLLFLTLDS